ncbi:cupin domain-containing protein [Aquimonas voraii]|uniref:50S ribosomal protein L16 3-hydroxylase n=1 Tax=Aquimonas voraii TaxID=265719 RepID=A0A1G6S8A0_9GAMM|nr:cupin domain-containing protein [Aquimonas voraii]SDD12395.1 50S ribosomal protein L16 3-hydroxylase [Aquimonas voraii]
MAIAPRKRASASTLPIEVQASAKQRLGMAPAAFLRDYWQKRPLLIRGAFADLACPITPEDLAGLACEDGALSRLVLHDRRKDQYALETGPLPEERFASLGERDWTLLVQDVDKWDADVAALKQHYGFLPRWRIDDIMISYAVPGGSVGPHVDQYDVFLMQGLGERRWQIDVDPAAPKTFREGAQLRLLQQFTPSHDWVLGPGDVLYLPPGVPHHGVAETPCLTLSLGMRAPSVNELVTDLADELGAQLTEELRYVDPDLSPASDCAEIDAQALARVRDALAPLLAMDDEALGRWFGRFITAYRNAGTPQPGPRLPSRSKLDDTLAAGGQLGWHPFSRSAWARQGRAALLFVHGEAYPCSLAGAKRLARGDALVGADWNALKPQDRDSAWALLQAGHLILQPARKPRAR